jgi:hypothetical protein
MATNPNTFHVERASSIQAAPEKIFPLINDFRNWRLWSPYEKLDPAMKKTYGGAASGQGAVYEWSGNNKAGQGRMEIIEASAPLRIAIKLDFIKPFEGHNIAEFTLRPNNGSTELVWSMSGPQPFIFRLLKIFISMDKMLGKDFEAGLAKLKSIAEEQSKTGGAV